MNREVEVYADLEGCPHLVGRLWSRLSKGREGASFAYDPSWLSSPLRFPLEPALMLDTGTHHTSTGRSLFGALGDSAPDRWGRILMKRMERKLAEREGRSPRTLMEIDYLLRVNDEARPGALRFKDVGSENFLASGMPKIPPLVYLPKLLSASDHLTADKESDEDLQLLLAPGSSLGGARPKAVVADSDGNLLIAKFPHREDEYRVEQWSYLVLKLAAKAGITVPPSRLIQIKGRSVLLVTRFDRRGRTRIPFLSAMSMLSAADGEPHSYLEIVDALRKHGSQSQTDQRELWQRVLFSVLISNVDDHLRNHGFLYDPLKRGWHLSPVYDLNPVPRDVKPPYLSTLINENESEASLELVMSTGEYYGLTPTNMRQIITEMIKALSSWRSEAKKLGIPRVEIDRMASAFEHPAHAQARTLVSRHS
jgi:serine/threonine-protein kinase HipA